MSGNWIATSLSVSIENGGECLPMKAGWLFGSHVIRMDATMSALEFFWQAALIPAVLLLIFSFHRHKAAKYDGWRCMTPGPMMWCAAIGGFVLTAVLWYIYLFVGSDRADADFQMRELCYVLIGFNLPTLAIAYQMVAEEVRWNARFIERRLWPFKRRSMAWHQLARLGHEPWGYWWISGYEGPKIRFSSYYNGFAELIAKIRKEIPSDLPPAASAALAAIPVRAKPE